MNDRHVCRLAALMPTAAEMRETSANPVQYGTVIELHNQASMFRDCCISGEII